MDKKPPNTSFIKQARHIAPLTSIRGIAAIGVVLLHYLFAPNGVLPFLSLLVDLFFVLSGFILCYVYLPFFTKHGFNKTSLKRFMVARVARIYPLHLFTVIFVLAAAWGHLFLLNPNPLDTLLTTEGYRYNPNILLYVLTLTQAWGFLDQISFNGPSWSISAEFFCYLLFPLFAFGLLRWKHRSFFTHLLLLASFLYYAVLGEMLSTRDVKVPFLLTYDYGNIRALAGFFLGMWVYLQHERFRRSAFLKSDAAFGGASALSIFMLLGYVNPLLTPFIIVFLLLCLTENKGTGAYIMSKPRMLWLGEISYALYLIHMPIYSIYREIMKVGFSSTPPSTLSLEAALWCTPPFIASLIAAHLLYHYLEIPMRDRLRKKK